MMKKAIKIIFLMLALLAGEASAVATCTSKATGNWGTASTWNCVGTPAVTVPGSTNPVVLASPYTVTLNNDYTVVSLIINSGATLSDTNGRTLTVTGDITNNGTFTSTNNGTIASTGNAAIISGNGIFSNRARLYTSGTAPTIPAGSTLTFSGSRAQLRTGRNANGNTVANSVLTINGTLNGSAQTGGTNDPFIRLYASNTIVGSTGVILATGTATIQYSSTGTLTNNGSVTIGTIVRSKGNGTWTNAANSSLTVNTSFSSGSMTLNASASGNTVTYNSPATPITPSGSPPTYYNLDGTGVVCPVSFKILGTSKCPASPYVQGSPSSCTNVTGVGTIAWANSTNAYASDNAYAVASNMVRNTTTNYLNCTGFNLNAPSGATITGITVSVERKGSKSNTFTDAFVYLIKGGTISTALNGATATSYPTTKAIEAHGGSTQLWNTAWTVADVNAANFGVAFASKFASSSNNNRTVSVDHIQIRVDYTLPTLHHFRIEHDGAASTCATEAVTIKACANAACTSYYTGGDISNIGLSPTTAGTYTWSPGSTASIPAANNGISSGITLARSSNGTGTLAITGTSSPAPSNAYDCYNTAAASNSCNLVFSSTSFSFNVPDHTAANKQAVTLTSCASGFANQTRNVKFWSTYVNPATGTLPGKIVAGSGNADCATGYSTLSTTSGTPTTLSLAFSAGAAPQATFSLCYPDVGAVKLDNQYNGSAATGDNGVTITGNDSFIAKPDHFEVSGIKRTSDNVVNPAAADATGSAFIAAGDTTVATTQFSAIVTAKNALNATTPNFAKETTPEGVSLTVDTPIVAPTGGAAGLLTCMGSSTGCVIPGGTTNFTSGASKSTALIDMAWNEVGVIKIMPKIGDGDYLGTGEVTTPTASGNIGRFYPDHFDVTPDATTPIENRSDWCQGGVLVADGITPCTSPAYTYMGEEMNARFTLTAMSAGGTLTSNYITSATAGQNFAKLDLVTSAASLGLGAVNDPTGVTPTYLNARLDSSLSPGGSFNVGVADVVAPIAFARSAGPDGPYALLNIGIAPVDSDGVAADAALLDLGTTNVATPDHVSLGITAVRFGRLAISDTSTISSALDLHLPMLTQYWDGSAFITNADDQETTLSASNFHFKASSETGYMHLSGAAQNMDDTHISLTGSILNGAFKNGALDGLVVAKPSPIIGGRGSAIVEVDLSATGENKPYLLGKGTNYSLSPSATVTFGSNNNNYKSKFIDLRESY